MNHLCLQSRCTLRLRSIFFPFLHNILQWFWTVSDVFQAHASVSYPLKKFEDWQEVWTGSTIQKWNNASLPNSLYGCISVRNQSFHCFVNQLSSSYMNCNSGLKWVNFFMTGAVII